MFKKIVAATDGSQFADHVVATAARLATTCGADLCIVTVVPRRGELPEAVRARADRERQREGAPRTVGFLLEETYSDDIVERACQAILDDAAASARRAGVPAVETVLEHGDPVARILDRSPAGDAILLDENVARDVLFHAKAPCLIVK